MALHVHNDKHVSAVESAQQAPPSRSRSLFPQARLPSRGKDAMHGVGGQSYITTKPNIEQVLNVDGGG